MLFQSLHEFGGGLSVCTEPPPVSETCMSHGHVIKGPCDNTGRSRSREIIILLSLVAIGTLVIET